MKIKFVNFYVKVALFATAFVAALWMEDCAAGKKDDWLVELRRWKLDDLGVVDGPSMLPIAEEFRSITPAELDSLTKVVNGRYPGYSAVLKQIFNDLFLYGSDYGVTPDDATFEVDPDSKDDTAAEYATGEKLVALAKLTLVEPVIVPEVPDAFKAIFDETVSDNNRVYIYTKTGEVVQYLAADENGYLQKTTDAKKSPLDAELSFEVKLYKNYFVGLKSSTSGNFLSAPKPKNLSGDKFATLLKFDAQNFEAGAAQQLVVEEIVENGLVKPDSFRLRCYAFNLAATTVGVEPVQEGYLKIDTDGFCRAVVAGAAVKQADASIFYIAPFSKLLKDLVVLRGATDLKVKIATLQNIVKNRGQYIVDKTPDIQKILTEVEAILELAGADADAWQALQDNKAAFNALVDSLSSVAETATTVAKADVNFFKALSRFSDVKSSQADWGAAIKTKFTALKKPIAKNLVAESIKATSDAAKNDAGRVLIFYEKNSAPVYLSADANGYLLGQKADAVAEKNPIDPDAAFELLLYKNYFVGFKSKVPGNNRNLTISNVVPKTTATDTQKQLNTLLRFDSNEFASDKAVRQQIIAELDEATGGYKLRGVVFNKPADASGAEPAQEGYIKVADDDGYCRVMKSDGTPFNKLEATVFYIDAFSETFKELAKARQNTNPKSKIDILQGLVKERVKYRFEPEDVVLLCKEIEKTIEQASTDKAILKGLQDSSDAFNALILSMSSAEATPTSFAATEINEATGKSNWKEEIDVKFERATGLVPNEFKDLIYPLQVANLDSRIGRQTDNTIQEFIDHLNMVLGTTDGDNKPDILVKLFDQEAAMLNRIITKLQDGLIIAYNNKQGTLLKNNLNSWKGEIIASGRLVVDKLGVATGLQNYLENYPEKFIEDLNNDLYEKDSSGQPKQRVKISEAEQDYFLKKAKRLVENRTKIKTDADLVRLKGIVQLGGLNQVSRHAVELEKLAGLLSTTAGLIAYSAQKGNYEEVLKSLEDGRIEQKTADKVANYVKNFWDLAENIFLAVPSQVDRMRTLFERINTTKIFTAEATKATVTVVSTSKTDAAKLTVGAVLAKIDAELKKVVTFADLRGELEALVKGLEATNSISDDELADFVNAVTYLVKTALEKTQIDELSAWVKYVLNNINKSQLVFSGKNLEALSAALTKMSEELAKKISIQPTYDSRLANILSPKADATLTLEKKPEEFIEELRWLAKNAVQGTQEERDALVKNIESALQYNATLSTKTPKGLNDETTAKPYKEFVKELIEKLKATALASDIFADLRVTNVDTAEKQLRYLSKAKTLLGEIKKLKFIAVAGVGGITTDEAATNNNLLEDVKFELNGKKAYALKNLATEIDVLLADLAALGKSPVAEAAFSATGTFVESLAWVAKNFGQKGEKILADNDSTEELKKVKMDTFAKNLGSVIDRQVEATVEELKKLNDILSKAQFLYANSSTYDKAWFSQKLDVLASGPGIVTTVNYLTTRKDALIMPGTKLEERERGQLLELVGQVVDSLKKAQTSQIGSLNKFIETLDAIKTLVITDKKDLLDAAKTQTINIIKTLEESLRVEPKSYTSELNKFSINYDNLYFAKNMSDAEKARGINELSQALEQLVDNIAEALVEDVQGKMDKKENKNIGGLLGANGVFDDLNNLILADQLQKVINIKSDEVAKLKKKVEDGPTIQQIYAVLVKISEKTDPLDKRDRDLVVEHASKLGNQQNLPKYFDQDKNAEILNKAKGLFKIIANMQMTNFKNESSAINNFAANIDTFLKSQNVASTTPWEDMETKIAELKTFDLAGQAQLETLKTLLTWFIQNKAYATKTQLEDIAMLVGSDPANANSLLWASNYYKKNESNAMAVEKVVAPLRDELAKPSGFKLRAENLIAYINDENQQPAVSSSGTDKLAYESWAKDRLDELSADDNLAFKEGYSLDRLIVSLKSFESFIQSAAMSYIPENGAKRAFIAEGQAAPSLQSFISIFEGSKSKIQSKGATIQSRIKDVEDRINRLNKGQSKDIAGEEKAIYDNLDYLINLAKVELAESERTTKAPQVLDAFTRYITNKKKTTTKPVLGTASASTKTWDELLKALKNSLQLPLSNIDRLTWFKFKIFGNTFAATTDGPSEDEFTAQEKETFLRIAEEAAAVVQQTKAADLKSIAEVLWIAYDFDIKVGAEPRLEQAIITLSEPQDSAQTGLVSYSTKLDNLKTLLEQMGNLSTVAKKITIAGVEKELTQSNAATYLLDGFSGFIVGLKELVNYRAEAYGKELDALNDLLTAAFNNRTMQSKGKQGEVKTLQLEVAKELTHEDIFKFIKQKLGINNFAADGQPELGSSDVNLKTSVDLQNLMVAKISELVDMREAVTDVAILNQWKSAIGFGLSNELAGKRDAIKPLVAKIDEYIESLTSSIFKTVSERIDALTLDFNLLPTSLSGSDAAKQATVIKVEMFIDNLNAKLLKFVCDAKLSDVETTDEAKKIIAFLTLVRAHKIVQMREYAGLKGKVDKLLDKAKAVRTSDELMARLGDMVKENMALKDAELSAFKEVFVLLLNKIIVVRDSIVEEKKKALIDDVLDTAINSQFKGDSLRINNLTDLKTQLLKPSKPPFDQSVTEGKFLDALVSLETDFAASATTFSNADWYSKLIKVSGVESIKSMYAGKPKAEQLIIVGRVEKLVRDISKQLRASAATEDKDKADRLIELLVLNRLGALKTEINQSA